MSEKDIIRVFYEHIIKEATHGRIDSFRYFNLPFNTLIRNNGEEVMYRVDTSSPFLDKDGVYPILEINNVELFNSLLIEYVHKALDFYDDSNFYDEVLNGSEYDENRMISKEKWIICSLIANMSYEDFANPYGYLESRISMFDNRTLDSEEEIDLGYVEMLKGRLYVREEKERIDYETPYVLKIKLHSDILNQDYYLPDVRMGCCKGKSIFYCIQRELYNNNDLEYVKFVNRQLHKVDQGLDVKDNTYENYGEGNLKDITPSFLISALIGCMLSKNKDIEVIPLLIERWYAKRIATRVKAEKRINKDEFIQLEDEKQVLLQNNLTQKFIRLFRRLSYHIDGIDYDFSSRKTVMGDNLATDNNLLNEVIEAINTSKKEIKEKTS